MVVGFLIVSALARAGTISGTVRATPPAGAPPEAGAGADDAYASRRYKYAERIDYEHLRDFVVYIDQAVSGAPVTPIEQTVTTTQKDANFEPHVLAVAVGTSVLWPNEDDIFHNVFSMSDAKEFDLGYYKKERVPRVTFDKVGRIDVYCAIHTKMHCVILVVPNRFFAMADAKGRFTIRDLPAGRYTVRAWHERLPSRAQEVVVPAEGVVGADFTLGPGGLPKY